METLTDDLIWLLYDFVVDKFAFSLISYRFHRIYTEKYGEKCAKITPKLLANYVHDVTESAWLDRVFHTKKSALDMTLYQCATCNMYNECEILIARGASNFDEMLRYAAFNCCSDICTLARRKGATAFDSMLIYGVYGNHKKICRMARTWGATQFDKMLFAAASRGFFRIVKLAISWCGKKDWLLNAGLLYAAGNNQLRICRYLYAIGARNTTNMLEYAAKNGAVAACKLAVRWNADTSNLSDWCIESGNKRVCEYAISLKHNTVEDLNRMLYKAAVHGRTNLCGFFRDLGANDFDYMLDAARLTENYEIAELANQWMREQSGDADNTDNTDEEFNFDDVFTYD